MGKKRGSGLTRLPRLGIHAIQFLFESLAQIGLAQASGLDFCNQLAITGKYLIINRIGTDNFKSLLI